MCKTGKSGRWTSYLNNGPTQTTVINDRTILLVSVTSSACEQSLHPQLLYRSYRPS